MHRSTRSVKFLIRMNAHHDIDALLLIGIGVVADKVALHTRHKLPKFASETLFAFF